MDEYGQLLPYFEGWIREELERVPAAVRRDAREIRLRLGQPLSVVTRDGPFFPSPGGRAGRKVAAAEIAACLRRVCGYSMQSCEGDLARGFCTLRGGHRVGVAGTVAAEGGKILSLREAGSLNFRIARQIFGAAGTLPQQLYSRDPLPSVLLAGPPASGKTTILRDLIRRLSAGECGRPLQIAAVDERGGLGGGRGLGEACLDLGPCTDLLSGYPKGLGMAIALRSLSPSVIACDELGGTEEAAVVLESVNAGVPLLATAHGDSLAGLQKRPGLAALLEAGAFDAVVWLKSCAPAGISWLKEGAA